MTSLLNISVDWQQFHFLRPGVLYLCIPLGLICLIVIRGKRERQQWKAIITPAFRPYMFSPGSRSAFIFPVILFIAGVSCAIVGAAGPAWKKVEIPGQKVQAVVLVAMDLSASMLLKDIAPNRLERAKLKLAGFLQADPGASTALLAYAGTPHIVLPFTRDYGLINFQAGSLDNWEMPVQGKNTSLMLAAVDTLMKPVSAPSHILIMTDSITTDDMEQFTQFVDGNVHQLEILFVAPAASALPALNNPRIRVTPLTLDTTDVGSIAGRVRDQLVYTKDPKKDDKNWKDMGAVLIIPALLITLYWFRRGWVIQVSILLLVTAISSCSVESRQRNWWYTKDYQGQVLYNEGKFAASADQFSDPAHKGAAYYKAGDYEAAAAVFALDSSAAGTFNYGLSLLKLGKTDEAMVAFDDAAGKDTSLRALVLENKKLMKITRVETDAVMRYDQKNDSLVKKAVGKDSLHERTPSPQDQHLASETQVKQLPKSGDRLTETVKSNIHEARESDDPGTGKPDQSGKQQDLKGIILRKPPADPGMFLHKRFVLQQQRYYKNIRP